eukprot:COSAG04_NODE_3621_length_2667_cov_3.160436_3_plen_109_part_00
MADRHLDGADQFNLNTNVRQVLESLPGKTSDVFGKCLNVCAVAISDTEPERRLLGLALLQILPRLLLTPGGSRLLINDQIGREPSSAAMDLGAEVQVRAIPDDAVRRN